MHLMPLVAEETIPSREMDIVGRIGDVADSHAQPTPIRLENFETLPDALHDILDLGPR